MIRKILLLVCVFILGILVSNIYSEYVLAQKDLQIPQNNQEGGYEYSPNSILGRVTGVFQEQAKERPSPADRIKEDQILVTNEKVVINIKNAEWASFTDTNSMDPVIDAEAHAIQIIPASEDEVHTGDIAAYESEYAEGTIIHRVVYKGTDEQGTYFLMKGDNNPFNDPGRIRFNQIRRVVVAIIY